MKKRIFSFLLVLVMVLGMVPVTAFAAVDLPVSGGTVDVEDTTVGPYTVKTLDVYLQSSYAPVSIISATQDGNTINIVLAADTDPSAALQARFGGNGSGVLQHSGNKCSLSGGTGTMTYAIAVMMGPQIAGSSTYEDGTNVYMILTEDTADNAQINVTFGTSLNRCTMEGTTGSLTLDGGEGDLSMTLTGKYSGNRKGTATYNLVFFREDPATEPPTRLVATDAKEIYKSTSVTLNLRTYFEKASKYYLVVDGVNTPIDGYQYTFTAANPGQQTLVFAAANTVGNCPDTVSVTFNVLDITSGVWVGQTSSNGSWNFVQFKDAEGNLIQGVDAKVEGKNIEVVLPQNFDPNGKVSAVFSLTQNNGLPVLTTKTATSGTSSSQWNGNTFTSKTTTLSSGKASYTFYYCNQSPKNESPVTWTLSYKIFNNPPALTQGQAATAEATITAGEAFALDLAPLFVDAENDALTYLVSIDGATPIAADANYSFTTDVAKTYSLVFTANDGKDTSTDTYTVILTVENTTQTDSMTVFVPKGLEPKFYVSPSFEVVTRLRRLVKLTMR